MFVLVLDPRHFGGTEPFLRETGWMAEAVHSNPPAPGGPPPRLPGAGALRRKAEQLAAGIALHPSIPPVLEARGRAAGVPLPPPD